MPRCATKPHLIGLTSYAVIAIGPWWATRRTASPSRKSTAASYAPQTRAALPAMLSSTGCRFVGELEITRRISLVAVCCARDSVRERLRVSTSVVRCAFDPVGGLAPLRGLAQSSQNFAVGRFSCWHRGHFIAYSPRAGRGSGAGDDSAGAGAGQ